MIKPQTSGLLVVSVLLLLLVADRGLALSAMCPSLARTLQLDSRGNDVTLLQQYLVQIGFLTAINVTGYFNLGTQSAVRQYQSSRGIVSSGSPATTGWGVVGAKTRAAIASCAKPKSATASKPLATVTPKQPPAPAPIITTIRTSTGSITSSAARSLSRGMRGADVTALQQFLITQNLLSSDSATGFFGTLTEAAVRKFQLQRGIVSSGAPATTGYGLVGPKTRAAIASGSSNTADAFADTNNSGRGSSGSPSTSRGIYGGGSSSGNGSADGGDSGGGVIGPVPSTTSASCTFNGQPVAHGAAVTAYQNSSVAFGQTCASQTRMCQNGTLSGSYQYSSCSVGGAASCKLDGVDVAHNASATFYSARTVPFGSLCFPVSQTRTCANGTLSGDAKYQYGSCSSGSASSCTFSNQSVAHGASITAYQLSSVAYGQTCISQTRTCTNGTLSGTYPYASCTVQQAAAPSCSITVSPSTITIGQTATLTWSSSNTNSATITGGVGSAQPNGSMVIKPTTTTYTMTATGQGGSATCSATVTVNPVPWPIAPGASTVDAEMAPFINAAGTNAAAWLQGDTLGKYLYGPHAQEILHGIVGGFGDTGDTSGRTLVSCADVAQQSGLAVILVAGQSNGANSASGEQMFTTNNPIYNFNIGDGKCYGAKEPVLGTDKKDTNSQAFILPVASYLIDSGLFQKVLIVPVAVSGTLIEEWRPDGGKYFGRIQTAIDTLKSYGLTPTFVLWHQGEGNAGGFIHSDTPDPGSYHIDITTDLELAGTLNWMQNFFKIVDAIRAQGVIAPIFPALATRCGDAQTSPVIRKAQTSVVDTAWGIYSGPDTDAIDLRRSDDGCHFNSAGNLAHAQAWFNVLRSYIASHPFPASASIAVNGQSSVTLPINGGFTIAWGSSNASSCTLSRVIAGVVQPDSPITPNTTGSSAGAAPAGTTTYTLTCTNSAGQSASKTATVVGQ